jgi:curved DNA-binding protein CbpA
MDDEAFAAAFRSLAKRKHPDTGGSNQEMQRINDAYHAMRARRK